MKKKLIIGTVFIILIFSLVFGPQSFRIEAAKCTPKDGSGVCVGECCMTLMTGGCIAGPCGMLY
ncbi:MAG: hypothetical protein KAW12_11300 [Candidatus Aminicenantes bacterium]|nr:hypothetical protein [Candidatus Aminicenantes bacterium]